MSSFLHNLARRTEPVTDLRPRLLSRFEAEPVSSDPEPENPSAPDDMKSESAAPQLSFDQPRTLLVSDEQPKAEPSAESATNLYQHITSVHPVEQRNHEITRETVRQPDEEIHGKLGRIERKLAAFSQPVPATDGPAKPALPDQAPPTPRPEGPVRPDNREASDSSDERKINWLERQWAAFRNAPTLPDESAKPRVSPPPAPQVTHVHNTQNAVQSERVVETTLATPNLVPEVRSPEPAPIHGTPDHVPAQHRSQPASSVAENPESPRTETAQVPPTVLEPQKKMVAEQTPRVDTDGIAQKLLKKLRRAVLSGSEPGGAASRTSGSAVQSLQAEKTPAVRSTMTAQKTINVSIGRVEVRAAASGKAAPQPPATAPAPASRVMSLDEYIARRSSGGKA